MIVHMNARIISFLFMQVMAFSSLAKPINLHCCIVRSEEDALSNPTTIMQISNELSEVNRIFRQVAMSFRIDNCVYTNDSALVSIVETNEVQLVRLMSILDCGEGLNLYFVSRIIGEGVAFHTDYGIVFDRNFSASQIAHEIGHACGLNDVYDWVDGTNVVVNGECRKSWMPYDWGRYKSVGTHDLILKRLLMYGYTDNSGSDITYGDIHGLWYTIEKLPGQEVNSKVWHESLSPVGFHAHGNRDPHTVEW